MSRTARKISGRMDRVVEYKAEYAAHSGKGPVILPIALHLV